MNKAEIIAYLSRLDRELSASVVLYIYGSAVVILLDAPERTSLDIDVAGPYSSGNMAEIACASQRAGLPLNPDPLYQGNHLEWVGAVAALFASSAKGWKRVGAVAGGEGDRVFRLC